MVRARADGREDLVRLGRREDEDQVLWRLFHDLQQGVEALRGDHVRLVDDEDAVLGLGRGVEGLVAEVAGVFHTAVRGRVQFHDVDAAGAVRREADAAVALAARVGRRALHAVQRAGEDAGRRRLAAAARAAEQVRVVHPACRQSDAQRIGHVLLANDLGERGRTVLAIQSERHARNSTGGHRHKKGTPCTHQSPLILAAFRPWGGSRDVCRTRSSISVAKGPDRTNVRVAHSVVPKCGQLGTHLPDLPPAH